MTTHLTPIIEHGCGKGGRVVPRASLSKNCGTEKGKTANVTHPSHKARLLNETVEEPKRMYHITNVNG
jgi:hypothetical protein